MLGGLFQNLMSGGRSANAYKIIVQITGKAPSSIEMNHLKNIADHYSNEQELALSQMILSCTDRYDILGNLYEKVDPNNRKKIIAFFDSCYAQGLIKSEYIIDEFNKIKTT